MVAAWIPGLPSGHHRRSRILFSTDFFENPKEAQLANGLSSSLARGHNGYDLDMLPFSAISISRIRRDVWSFPCPNDNPSEEVGADYAR